ncbi:ATP-binding protein [Thalassiella azotivora]
MAGGDVTTRAHGRPGTRPPLRRTLQDRWVAGVAAGLATHLGVPVARVRAVLVLLVPLGGAGVLAYLLLWLLVPAAPVARRTGTAPADRRGGPTPDAGAEHAGGPDGGDDRATAQVLQDNALTTVAGAALVAVGSATLAQRAGVGVEPLTVAALAAIVVGALLAWGRLDRSDRARWLASAGGDTRPGLVRLASGVALAVVGLLLLLSGTVDAAALRGALLAAGAVLVGTGLLLAPWVTQLGRDLVAERAARVRADERAEIAAHLHDSVLQTLALVQKRADDPVEVTRLARAQERQLRQWLYAAPAPARLAEAVRGVVAEVEDLHGVPVEVVTVGDTALDGDLHALVQALREALVNAVRHGAPPVSVYVEVTEDGVEAFVRDHGPGVDLDAVPADRLGLRRSVLERMARHSGSASVRRPAGGGTEVRLVHGPLAAGQDGAGGAGDAAPDGRT